MIVVMIFILICVIAFAALLLIAIGRLSADPKLLEMAQVFRMPFISKVRYIYLPALRRKKS